MKGSLSKGILVAIVLAMPLLQVYAHHGNQFINQSLEANAAEVQLGEMASGKAENPRVKEFAHMVVMDHTKVFDQLRGLLDARMKVSTANDPNNHSDHSTMTPDKVQLTRQNQRTRDELAKLSGDQFDRRFIDVMVQNHRDSIRMFEEQSRAHGFGQQTDIGDSRQKPSSPNTAADFAIDRDTAAFAREILPTLRKHLQNAESIQKALQSARTN